MASPASFPSEAVSSTAEAHQVHEHSTEAGIREQRPRRADDSPDRRLHCTNRTPEHHEGADDDGEVRSNSAAVARPVCTHQAHKHDTRHGTRPPCRCLRRKKRIGRREERGWKNEKARKERKKGMHLVLAHTRARGGERSYLSPTA